MPISQMDQGTGLDTFDTVNRIYVLIIPDFYGESYLTFFDFGDLGRFLASKLFAHFAQN